MLERAFASAWGGDAEPWAMTRPDARFVWRRAMSSFADTVVGD